MSTRDTATCVNIVLEWCTQAALESSVGPARSTTIGCSELPDHFAALLYQRPLGHVDQLALVVVVDGRPAISCQR